MSSPLRLVVVAAAIVPLAYGAWIDAAKAYAKEPITALSVVNEDPQFVVELNERLSSNEQGKPLEARNVIQNASEALEARPLSPVALRQLDGYAGFAVDAKRNLETLVLAQKVSRRDRVTQLQLSVEQLRVADLGGAFRHIDRLLTVRPALISQVLPQLIVMLQNDQAAKLLRNNSDRPWFKSFLKQSMGNSTDLAQFAQFYATLDGDFEDVDPSDLRKFAARLARSGLYDQSLEIAERTGVDREALDDFAPNSDNVADDLAPLTWAFADEVDGTASLAENAFVDIEVEPGGKIVVLDRMFQASNNQNTIRLMIMDNNGPTPLLEWSKLCFKSGQWQAEWRSGWKEVQRGETEIALPSRSSTCDFPRWQMEVQAGEGQRSSGFLLRLSLR